MSRKRKYCSAQPYLDYIGVPEKERRKLKYSDNCKHRGKDFLCTIDNAYCPESQPPCKHYEWKKEE
jgi:hypothetical protein